MIKNLFTLFCMLCISTATWAGVEIGKAAPQISATDIEGNPFSLSDHKGSPVVLEWHNHECPFVVKFYKSGEMQKLQDHYAENGVKWVRVISSAPGKQGHVTVEEAKELAEQSGVVSAITLRDESGAIGKAYGAQTTPHMFVINAAGEVAYAGAIDSIRSVKPDDIAKAENFVVTALESLLAGEAVETTSAQPYGCSIKY